VVFAETVTGFTLFKPLRDKSGQENEAALDWLVRMVPLLCAYSNGAPVRLEATHADNGGSWTSGNAFDMDNTSMRAWRMRTGVALIRLPAHSHALNSVENATRRFNHVVNNILRAKHLSGKVWAPMGVAALTQLNCQTTLGSAHRLRRERTRFMTLTGCRPDLS
jgi:hypothetical protein